ncbi:hypothetical protein AVEN_159105-1 [Araneus ventricosus]|uniref:Uncharacterized protein n=1 Tax=Araneus ventricosus TaxID=182803 RepID=A0A4Y2B8J0_ARAVE|nr:hypothetical protein AVEN_159105-1 [Araneus ventricosus]
MRFCLPFLNRDSCWLITKYYITAHGALMVRFRLRNPRVTSRSSSNKRPSLWASCLSTLQSGIKRSDIGVARSLEIGMLTHVLELRGPIREGAII